MTVPRRGMRIETIESNLKDLVQTVGADQRGQLVGVDDGHGVLFAARHQGFFSVVVFSSSSLFLVNPVKELLLPTAKLYLDR